MNGPDADEQFNLIAEYPSDHEDNPNAIFCVLADKFVLACPLAHEQVKCADNTSTGVSATQEIVPHSPY